MSQRPFRLRFSSRVFNYFSSFFIIVAGVLGTGILALPVKLSEAGFAPFVLTYVVCFLNQSMLLVYLVFLLQKARAIMQLDLLAAKASNESDHADHAARLARLQAGPDLHLLGKMFLGKYSRVVFDLCVMLHFVSILISYALAGSQAYANMLGVASSSYLVLPFVCVFAGLVIFAAGLVRPVITVITFSKGLILMIMVFVTGVIGSAAKLDFVSEWAYIGRPLLIGTVALGGGVNVVPIVLAKVDNQAREIRRNLLALIAGLLFVWFLNVLWCYFVLRSVPQFSAGAVDCAHVDSLYAAKECGKIATIPLIRVVHEKFPEYNWIATFIDVFIMLSISISFVTMSLGTRHVLDGVAITWADSKAAWARRIDCQWRKFPWRRAVLYFFTWVPIYIIAQTNPRSFLTVMEKVTSLGLNLEAGVFICMMVSNAYRMHSSVKIEYDLRPWMFYAHYVVMGYFLFACVYDVALVVDDLIPN
jgi:amino acid permease